MSEPGDSACPEAPLAAATTPEPSEANRHPAPAHDAVIREGVRIQGQGLQIFAHRYAPVERSSNVVVLLLHGFMDAGGTWDAVARPLAAQGHTVVAPDFRGFGQSDRVPAGGYYHFADYVADVAAVVRTLEAPHLVVVGHSMGGTVASLFAGAMPQLVDGLILLEGVGPPDMAPQIGPGRMRQWLAQLSAGKKTSPLDSLDDAVRRLSANHPTVPRATLSAVAKQLTVERDGVLSWAFDPLHRTTSPMLFRLDAFGAFLEEVTCPVQFVSGGDTGWHPSDEAERLQAFSQPPSMIELDGAGHMMHWTQPALLAETISRFLNQLTLD